MKSWWCILGIIPVLEAVAVVIKFDETCPNVCVCTLYNTSCRGNALESLPSEIDPNVIGLDLSANNFKNIPESIKSFKYLKYLNMSMNLLSTLGHMDFDGLTNLEEIDLSFNSFHDWKDIQSDTFKNLNALVFLDFSGNSLRALPVYSNHFDVKSLKILKFNDSSIQSVPVGFLISIPNLKDLYLVKNPISSLKVNLSSASLKFLDLSDCTISSVSNYAFNGLTSLENLYIRRNKYLRNLTIHSGSLINLDLSESQLYSTPRGNIRTLSNLNLHGNILRELKSTAFMNFPNLISLNLSLNAITSINENAFKGLEEIKTINLSYNKLYDIEENTFLSTRSLLSLDLSHNYLTSIDSITSMTLNELDVSYCEINYISKNTLSKLPKLTELSLKRNFITSIPDNWLAESLVSLDLSNCRIKSINNKTFAQMNYLKQLDLSSNRLTSIHYLYFPRNILVILIRDNLWRCDCPSLKDTYDWFQLHGTYVDDLICDSPESVDGKNWLEACENQWYPSTEKKDHLLWYSVALLISMLMLLLTVVALRKLNEIREKRYMEEEERRRQQEREAREALQRMQNLQREYREESNQNAPDPRESQGPPSYNDALLLPRLDSSHPSLAGSLHSFGSRGSLHGSSGEVNKKGKVRRKKRRRRSESAESTPVRPAVENYVDSESEFNRRERPLESDF